MEILRAKQSPIKPVFLPNNHFLKFTEIMKAYPLLLMNLWSREDFWYLLLGSLG